MTFTAQKTQRCACSPVTIYPCRPSRSPVDIKYRACKMAVSAFTVGEEASAGADLWFPS